MSRRRLLLRVPSIILLVGLILGLAFPSGWAIKAQDGGFDRSTFQHERPSSDQVVQFAPGARGGPLAQQAGPARVVIELQDDPSAVAYAQVLGGDAGLRPDPDRVDQATAVAQAQLAKIEQAQQALLGPLSQLGATVLYRTQRVYNGIAVQVDAGQLASVRQLPGVKAVHPLIPKTFANASSVPLIGAPQLWSGLGVTGTGVKIGVIDTGIDYLHTNFGGPGTVITDTSTFTGTFVPTAKVAGGYDFVGDAYNASSSVITNTIPKPDPNPMDCNGHGSHVAGTAAGYGVNADGTTYTGTYGTGTNFSALRIGPGVAPGALLYALRVFGCGGSTDVVEQAIEWAVDPNGDGNFADHLDVINMSLGSDYGTPDDSSAVASDNAALAGVIVVASAGNAGDSYYVTGSPATSGRALSVASSVDRQSYSGQFPIVAPPSIAALYPASEAVFGPDLAATGPLTGQVAIAQPLNACNPITNASAITGKIALIQRGVCTFVSKVARAQAAGAVGVLVFQNVSGLPITMGGTDPTITIPSMMTDLSTGTLISNTIGAGTAVTVTLTAQYRNMLIISDATIVDTISSFTSRGPRSDSFLKPDISAPGDTVLSTGALSGNERDSLSGTSMSAPHVAGSMALLKQSYPGLTVEQYKALAMNTALNNLRTSTAITSTTYAPARIGAGRIELSNAMAANAVAYNFDDDGLVSVSFGAPEIVPGATVTMTKTIQVDEVLGLPSNYNVEYIGATDIPGVSFSVPSTLAVPGLSSVTFPVRMTANPAAMKHTRDGTVASTQLGLGRHWISEESGYVALIPSNATFQATLSGANEVPPVITPTLSGVTTFSYNSATNALNYTLTVTGTAPITITAAHIHPGLTGVNGPVALPLFTGPVMTDTLTVNGVVTPTAQQEGLLLGGDLYVNVHTSANPGGEIRGQIVATGARALRVPVHAAPRLASAMSTTANQVTFTSPAMTTTVTLTGTGLNTGTSYPTDLLSLVAGLELQEISGRNGLGDEADLQYLGVASDYPAQSGVLTNTAIFFGIATHGNWTSPNPIYNVEFDIYMDTNRDGTPDYALFNWNLSQATGGVDPNDVFVTVLVNLNTGAAVLEDFLNGIPANVLDTALFNTNVMVLPVYAADLGLSSANPTFDYFVETFNRSGAVDVSQVHTYDPTHPGLDFSGGVAGVPAYADLPGEVMSVAYDQFYYRANQSQGALLLHSHNTGGNHAQVLNVVDTSAPIFRYRIFLPVLTR